MRVLIKVAWRSSILTRPLSPEEMSNLLAALDGAAMVEESGPSNSYQYRDSNTEPDISFISSLSPNVPQVTLVDYIRNKRIEAAQKEPIL